jgi:hypothetical protein
MNCQDIYFNNFIDTFYSNKNQTKMVLQIDIESVTNNSKTTINNSDTTTNNSETTIYDIHCMLLDLLVAGVQRLNLNFVDDEKTINNQYSNLNKAKIILQNYFNNINIKLNIINYSKQELLHDNSPYENRYIKFTAEKSNNFIINGQHKQLDNLEDIRSFFLIDDNTNISISFTHSIIE